MNCGKGPASKAYALNWAIGPAPDSSNLIMFRDFAKRFLFWGKVSLFISFLKVIYIDQYLISWSLSMVKRNTGFLTRAARPIYSENGEFYVRRHNNTGWYRVPNTWAYFTWTHHPNNGNYNNVNLFHEGYVGTLKRRRNQAARTIQRFERGRASRKRTAFAHSAFGRALPANLVRRILRRNT